MEASKTNFHLTSVLNLLYYLLSVAMSLWCNYKQFMHKLEKVAEMISAGWCESGASTLTPNDVKDLTEKAPSFGILDEKCGSKIYAFLPGGKIKKHVISSDPRDFKKREEILNQIRESGLSIKDLHRRNRNF